jgi:hypothetical protein
MLLFAHTISPFKYADDERSIASRAHYVGVNQWCSVPLLVVILWSVMSVMRRKKFGNVEKNEKKGNQGGREKGKVRRGAL